MHLSKLFSAMLALMFVLSSLVIFSTTASAAWNPTITSTPATVYAHFDGVYYYNITANESCTYSIISGSNAATLVGNVYSINLSAYWRTYWGITSTGGPYSTTIRATSVAGTGHTDQVWNIWFTDADWAPTYTNSPGTSVYTGATYYYNATMNETSTIQVITAPAWADVSDGKHIHGSTSTPGSYYFHIHAWSTNGSLSTHRDWYVSVAPASPWAPTITSSPATIRAHFDRVYYYNMTANETSTYTVLAGINAGAINATTGRYTINLSAYWRTYWGVPSTGSGPYLTEFKVTSANGTLSSYQFINITVSPTSYAPTIISSPSWSGKVGTTYYYNVTTNMTSTVQIVSAPAWANVTNPAKIHGIPTTYGVFYFPYPCMVC
jgi:hypothetical protein